MSECKKTCGNCAGLIRSVLSKDRCDMTKKPIENYSSTCKDWEPNRDTEVVMQKDELKALRKERDELQAQVAVLRGALERLTETIDDQIPLGGYCEEIGLNIDVMLEPWGSLFDAKGSADAALLLTPAEAAERVNALVEALEWIEKTTQDTGAQDAANDALAAWRGQEN